MNRNKYNARGIHEDGYYFDSQMELRRYRELKLLIAAGVIRDLEIHPRYDFEKNGVLITTYRPDFVYVLADTGAQVVEDVKGVQTEVYKIKKKLMKAFYGLEVVEVEA